MWTPSGNSDRLWLAWPVRCSMKSAPAGRARERSGTRVTRPSNFLRNEAIGQSPNAEWRNTNSAEFEIQRVSTSYAAPLVRVADGGSAPSPPWPINVNQPYSTLINPKTSFSDTEQDRCQGASQFLRVGFSNANAAWGHAAYNTRHSMLTLVGRVPRPGAEASNLEVAQKLRCARGNSAERAVFDKHATTVQTEPACRFRWMHLLRSPFGWRFCRLLFADVSRLGAVRNPEFSDRFWNGGTRHRPSFMAQESEA
jgi:hypothetical protein